MYLPNTINAQLCIIALLTQPHYTRIYNMNTCYATYILCLLYRYKQSGHVLVPQNKYVLNIVMTSFFNRFGVLNSSLNHKKRFYAAVLLKQQRLLLSKLVRIETATCPAPMTTTLVFVRKLDFEPRPHVIVMRIYYKILFNFFAHSYLLIGSDLITFFVKQFRVKKQVRLIFQ